jgi:hypothetical protein
MIPSLGFVSERPFSLGFYEEIEDQNFVKPLGGLWLSRIQENEKTLWQNWCEEQRWSPYEAPVYFQEVFLRDNAKVIRLHSFEDFEELIESYPSPHDYSPFSFEALSKDFDVIWLTDRGERETRVLCHSLLKIPSLYGWDFETFLVLNKNVIQWLSIPTLVE